VVHNCYVSINEGDRGLLTIKDKGAYPCGLIEDPRVGPKTLYSYATADAGVPGPSPVMYAGPLAPAASRDIIDREKLKAISAQAAEYVNRLIAAISPDLAYAAQPFRIQTPDRKGQPLDWTGAVYNSIEPSENVYSYEFDIAYTNGIAFKYELIGSGGSKHDVSVEGEYDWSKYQAIPPNSKHGYDFVDVQNPISGDYETFLSTTLDYADGTVDGYPGEFWLTIKAEDATSPTSQKEYALLHFINTAAAPPDPLQEQSFKIQACAGDYAANCDNSTPDYIRRGLLQEYWSKARFGFSDYQAVDNPTVGFCIEESVNSPDAIPSAFTTNVRLSSALGDFQTYTYLVDGHHEAILSFMGKNSAPVCDPFKDDETKCRNNFVLMLTSAEGADLVTDTSTRVFDPLPSDCDSAGSDLAKNACYAYNTDLRSDTVGASDQEGIQKVSTYIVDSMSTNPANSAILQEAAELGGGNYYGVENPRSLREELKRAFEDIIKRAASGTAASVLASGEGSGANLIQA
ncbi:hypothetical protein LCGC14_2452650, partial [marine sediment metagenome]